MSAESGLPAIPVKRYFTIGEVADLCGVKPHVLRYWEQEFTQLRPMKRRGNRRYYQHHEVLMIRRIRDLLYEQGFTISGARNKLQEWSQTERGRRRADALDEHDAGIFDDLPSSDDTHASASAAPLTAPQGAPGTPGHESWADLRRELLEIRKLLGSENN
ncbi:MAG: hypothetical protein GAK30_03379 [Paracidovorax wautersii]|uniref:HTH merR-type domain-containing protein n=1 Tax=Paracidovorax wautersii TaxID=1177982 RepID=A0A7V8JP90_9BURK|nr:MAG: hypothetical protein GAK30_03379 [Paracidovorax wautersii]